MKKFVRYGLITLVSAVGLLLLTWAILLIYVSVNEKELIGKIAAKVHERTRGEVQIKKLSVSLIRTFPVLSLELKDITLRDSLFAVHKKDLLRGERLYIQMNLRSILAGEPKVGTILLRRGEINILTDSTGYTNEYVLKSTDTTARAAEPVGYPNIILEKVLISFINPLRNKFHQGEVQYLRASISENNGMMAIHLRMQLQVKSLAFNTEKGPYLKDKSLAGNIRLRYDRYTRNLLLPNIMLQIDGHPFHFDGKFHFDASSPDFELAVSTFRIPFSKAVSVLSDSLQRGVKGYNFSQPIDVSVQLKGKTLFHYVPATRLVTSIDLGSVNNFGSEVFALEKGTASIDVLFDGPVGRPLEGDQNIEGVVLIKDAQIRYKPRGLTLKNLGGSIKLAKGDLVLDSLVTEAGDTKLEMTGGAKNFASILNDEPEKLDVSWKIYSPGINLEDFGGFLSNPSASPDSSRSSKSISGRIDETFADGDMMVSLQTPKMTYKTFKATAVKANAILKKSEVDLENVSFNHAGGRMEISGVLQNRTGVNPVQLRTTMTNMNVQLLFAAFDNFGQDALTSKNLKGTLSADVRFNTAISDKAKMITDRSEGVVKFKLEDGELNNFAPLIDVGNKVFKKQDFSKIAFADLANSLDIKGTTFIVNPMDIRSTALNLSVEGIYDYKKGTDMSIRLPLKNLTKSQANTDLSEGVKIKKGVSLRLRARTGDDGKLKVSWDPFGRAVKGKRQKLKGKRVE